MTITDDDNRQQHQPKSSKDRILSPLFAFSLLLLPRLLAAQYSIIGDCDEVYNYWEPTHYLVHGNGFQTWEYSPVYAIRSWAYVAVHALVIKAFAILEFTKQFYVLRTFLGVLSATCETMLVHYVQVYKNPSLGLYLLILLATSAGMFVAATAYLPSTFAMYGTTLAHAFSLQPQSRTRTVKVVCAVGITAILSWPFASVLVCVLGLQDLVQVQKTKAQLYQLLLAILKAGVILFFFLAFTVAVDSAAYRSFQIVPFNIVRYNIFGGENRGPNLFGTEPWWYYFLNLTLYFNVATAAAFLALPLTVFAFALQTRETFGTILSNNLPLVSVYLWIGIFSLVPHKEERFMYVIYPLICYNAAAAVESAASVLEVLLNQQLENGISNAVSGSFRFGVLGVYALLSLSRILAQIRAYAAPMQVYGNLESPSTICLGKEWYRFPSSFFIPNTSRASFVKSAFDGLLPGQFYESGDSGWRSSTWIVPYGMNDQNLEDLSHLVAIEKCDYFVDSDFPLRHERDNDALETSVEPRYPIMSSVWSRMHCERFLDAVNSGIFGRSLWLPIPALDRSLWGEFCMLQRNVER